MELLDALYDLQKNGNVLAIPRVLRQLLTPEAKETLFDHTRNPEGRVPIESISAEVAEIMAALISNKK